MPKPVFLGQYIWPALIFFCGLIFLAGAYIQSSRVNTDLNRTDQGAYISAVEQIEQSGVYLGDRNRMPLYPYLQSLFVSSSTSSSQIFEIGKAVNTLLSFVLLCGMGVFLYKKLPSRIGITVWLVSCFGLFIFRAPYYQAESLFYFLIFFWFICANKLLLNAEYKLAAIAGFLSALGYLTKATMLLGVVVFMTIWLGQLVYYKYLQQGGGMIWRSMAVFMTVFIGVLSPYLVDTYLKFGHPFYNVNSTFYVWYDSWEDAVVGTRAHGDRFGWPNLPADQIPGLGKYLREHTPGDIVSRVGTGLERIAGNLTLPHYLFASSVVLTFLAAAIYGVRGNSKLAKVIGQKYFWPITFCVTFLLVGVLSTAWYSPIASGPRFISAYFLPAIFGLSWVLIKLNLSRTLWRLILLVVYVGWIINLLVSFVYILPRVYTGS